MLTHPQFDPVVFSVGPLAIRWYGLMYVAAFVLFVVLGRLRARRDDWRGMTPADVDDLLFYGMFGVILGGRLGYVIFYKPEYYLAHPLEIFQTWNGGMSFHGGFLGVLVAIGVFCWRRGRNWWDVMDFIAPLVPLGLGAGRLGNFINGELPGRILSDPSSLPWSMWFPQHDTAVVYRHPSQLYQFLAEGVLLFLLLWLFSLKPRPRAAVSALFLIGYGSGRFVTEFGREPDAFLGLLKLGLSMGQWLSLPMIAAGVGLLIWAYRRRAH